MHNFDSDLGLRALVVAATLLPFVVLYWGGLFVHRRRLSAALVRPRPWQLPTLQGWVERRWLDPELVGTLPSELAPGDVFYEWAWADPDVAAHWRFKEPVTELTPFEALVRDAWANLPAAEQTRTRERLTAAIGEAATWWGGAERGWNRRPLALLGSTLTKRQADLPLLGLDDLTAAPMPAAFRAEPIVSNGEGVDLVLILAALRRSTPRFRHPLAPKASPGTSMIEGLSTKVATDVGSRIGAGLGAALGPIGSMVGQYLGGMVGAMGGQALARQALPQGISAALKETESALAQLGDGVDTDDFERAARQPEEMILELGKRAEVVREARGRRIRERIWPTPGLVVVESLLKGALRELKSYRSAQDFFLSAARKAPKAVAGGMILQNPWMVRRIPGSVERLNAARSALNGAAIAIRKASE